MKLEKLVKNLGSGLSLFSSTLMGALIILLFLNPDKPNLFFKIVVIIALIALKTALFYSLVKTLQLSKFNPKLLAVYILDVVGILILFFANVSKLIAFLVILLWVLVSLFLTYIGLPRY